MSRWLLVIACTAAVSASTAYAQTGGRASLQFETQALDLTTGQLHPTGNEAKADVRVAYHADRATHAVIVPARLDVETVLLDGVAWDAVDAGAVAGAAFAPVDDRPFEPDDSVLVRTPEGAVFKLGHPSEGSDAVSFDYAPVGQED